jgi:hypothetical protein
MLKRQNLNWKTPPDLAELVIDAAQASNDPFSMFTNRNGFFRNLWSAKKTMACRFVPILKTDQI